MAVPEVVEADAGRAVASARMRTNSCVRLLGWIGRPSAWANDVRLVCEPDAQLSSSWACRRGAAATPRRRSRAGRRFGPARSWSPSADPARSVPCSRRSTSCPPLRSTARQRSAVISPRRRPQSAPSRTGNEHAGRPRSGLEQRAVSAVSRVSSSALHLWRLHRIGRVAGEHVASLRLDLGLLAGCGACGATVRGESPPLPSRAPLSSALE